MGGLLILQIKHARHLVLADKGKAEYRAAVAGSKVRVVRKWAVCMGACNLGKQLKVPMYEFVKEALIRKYGEEWFKQLSVAASLLK